MVFGSEIFANPFSRLMLDYMSTPLLYLLYLILAVFILVNLLGWWVCVCVRVCVCARACVRACMHMHAYACICMHMHVPAGRGGCAAWREGVLTPGHESHALGRPGELYFRATQAQHHDLPGRIGG